MERDGLVTFVAAVVLWFAGVVVSFRMAGRSCGGAHDAARCGLTRISWNAPPPGAT